MTKTPARTDQHDQPAVESTVPMLPSERAAVARAEFVSQTTAVEQARAVAEVQAQVLVAQHAPRSMPAAIEEMREACNHAGLAERAFYKFPRAGGSVSGPSVHLARELARCFGNVQYGIQELRRDDTNHYSEMQAWAWDVERNTRSMSTFVVPHRRDKRGGSEPLVDLRDIYENNANQGARRLREAIFSILPVWFTEEAKALCAKTIESGGGKPLATRIADAIARFGELGIKVDRLEAKIGAFSADWTAQDVAQLSVSYASLRQGTVTADDEFPPIRVSASEITAPTSVGETQ